MLQYLPTKFIVLEYALSCRAGYILIVFYGRNTICAINHFCIEYKKLYIFFCFNCRKDVSELTFVPLPHDLPPIMSSL